MRMRACLAAISALVLVLQGCGALIGLGAGAAVGVAGEKYLSGNLETTYPVGMEQAVTAVQSAMKQSQIQLTDTRVDSTKAEITGIRLSDGAPVAVNLAPMPPNSTKADIRVGKLGDENAARILNRQIFESLK